MYIQCTSPGEGQSSCKVWLASGERHVEDILQFNNFFRLLIHALVARYSPTIDKVVRWSPDGEFLAIFCVLYFQRAACSTVQTCILNSHYGHTICGSIHVVDIQFPKAENRRGKKERRNHRTKILWLAVFYRAAIMTVKQQMCLC